MNEERGTTNDKRGGCLRTFAKTGFREDWAIGDADFGLATDLTHTPFRYNLLMSESREVA
jgi:hypothetical protein